MKISKWLCKIGLHINNTYGSKYDVYIDDELVHWTLTGEIFHCVGCGNLSHRIYGLRNSRKRSLSKSDEDYVIKCINSNKSISLDCMMYSSHGESKQKQRKRKIQEILNT